MEDDECSEEAPSTSHARNSRVAVEREEIKEEVASSDDDIEELATDVATGEFEILEYEQSVMLDTMDEDVIFLTARGLGLERLFLNHLLLYSDQKLLVFVLNTSPLDEAYFISRLKAACREGDSPPKLINADVSVKDREAIYLEGGVQFVTSRILMVDFLCDRVPAQHIAGILVYRAHQVLNGFQESFIIRLYRERKKDGFVKAFSDIPTAVSSLGELQRLVFRLYVKRVRLLPRFDTEVKRTFEKTPTSLTELSIDLPPVLRRIQATLVELLRVCGRELKGTVVSAKKKKQGGEEAEEESMVGVAYAPTALERQIADRRSFASDKQKRLLTDLENLRELLSLTEDLDACTLLSRMNVLRAENQASDDCSGWLLSSSASKLFGDAESLAGWVKQKGTGKFNPPPKWEVFASILDEIRKLPPKERTGADGKPAPVLVFTSNDILSRQLSDLVRSGIALQSYMVQRQLPFGCQGQKEPAPAPLWPSGNVKTFMRNQEDRAEIMQDVQREQKSAARATKRRRQVAENIFASTEGGRQTRILQFGILQHRKRRAETQPGLEKETEVVAVDAAHGTSRDGKEGSPSEGHEKDADEGAPLVILPHGQRYNIIRQLETLLPTCIVFYSSDVVTMRQVEIYKALNSHRPLRVYVLQYRNSTEEERYLSSLSREQLAFESLTRELQTLLVPRTYDVVREKAPILRQMPSSRDGGGRGRRDSDEQAEEERPQVIVDMREFASELPTVLYKKGFDVVAATLEVGDYILTPDTCVERKALDDLTQSLQSGRVFKQVEQMLAHYASVVLLIESNTKFDSKLVNGGPFQGELSRHCREIRMQLCVLVRKHPRLRLIWSLDPENSTEYFCELKMNKPQPDLAVAVSLHGEGDQGAKAETSAAATGRPRKPNSMLQRVLSEHLPFLSAAEVRRLMSSDRITCLADLFTADHSTLVSVLGEKAADRIEILTSYDFSAPGVVFPK